MEIARKRIAYTEKRVHLTEDDLRQAVVQHLFLKKELVIEPQQIKFDIVVLPNDGSAGSSGELEAVLRGAEIMILQRGQTITPKNAGLRGKRKPAQPEKNEPKPKKEPKSKKETKSSEDAGGSNTGSHPF